MFTCVLNIFDVGFVCASDVACKHRHRRFH